MELFHRIKNRQKLRYRILSKIDNNRALCHQVRFKLIGAQMILRRDHNSILIIKMNRPNILTTSLIKKLKMVSLYIYYQIRKNLPYKHHPNHSPNQLSNLKIRIESPKKAYKCLRLRRKFVNRAHLLIQLKPPN